MDDLGPKIVVEGLWIEDRQSRFEDPIMSFNRHVSLCTL